MKNLTLLVLVLTLVKAQAQDISVYKEISYTTSLSNAYKLKNGRIASWFSLLNYWESNNVKFQQAVDLKLFPDSTVRIILPSTENRVYYHDIHLVGTGFYPQSPLFERQTSRYVEAQPNLEIDSIRFPYTYYRPVDSMLIDAKSVEIIDTVFFQIHDYQNLSFQSRNTNIYTIPKPMSYDTNSIRYKNPVYEDTIFLNRSYVTIDSNNPGGYNYLSIAFDSSISVANLDNNLNKSTLGINLWYKPMQPYNAGDTLMSLDSNVIPSKQLNQFGTLVFSNRQLIRNEKYWNTPYFITKNSRYQNTPFYGLGATPSLVFFGFGRNYFYDFALHGSFDVSPVGIDAIDQSSGVTLRPNPVEEEQPVYIDFQINQPSVTTISILDFQGRIVKEICRTFFKPGNHTIDASLEGIGSGVYLFQIKTDQWVKSKKLIVH